MLTKEEVVKQLKEKCALAGIETPIKQELIEQNTNLIFVFCNTLAEVEELVPLIKI